MLQIGEELQCGVFDSRILRKNTAKSADRRVLCYELELFHDDNGVSHVDGSTYPVRRGMLLCAKPAQIRYSDFPVRCSYIRMRAGVDAELDALLSHAPDCFYITDAGEMEELVVLFAKLGAMLMGGGDAPWNTLRVNTCFLEILCRVFRLWQGGDTARDLAPRGMVRDACEFMREHYKEPCTLARMADALHISPNHLHTVFTKEMGLTPFAFLTQKRVEQAKRLIMAGERSMLEIGLEVGFCSQSHFNKVFKEQTGQTPVAYRRSLSEHY